MEQVLLDQITALRAQLQACAEVSGREVVTKHTLLTFLREHTSLELHELAGGFYAAQELARTAGVPFKGLDSYDRHVIHNYVGTMYGYSKDIAVKNAPEDFVYHTPRGLDYTTTYVTYKANKNYQIVSETKPYAGPYFKHFKDGSGMAYLTFMGGDQSLVKVSTGTKSNRKLLVIKDSYGNTVPGYMFYSFGEVHVVDFRYFNRNIKQYVAENGITDLVILFNVFNTCTSSSVNKVRRFLTQKGGSYAPVTVDERKSTSRDTVRQKPGKESPVSKEPPKTQEPAPAACIGSRGDSGGISGTPIRFRRRRTGSENRGYESHEVVVGKSGGHLCCKEQCLKCTKLKSNYENS